MELDLSPQIWSIPAVFSSWVLRPGKPRPRRSGLHQECGKRGEKKLRSMGRQYQAVPGSTRLYQAVPDSTRQYQAVPGSTWDQYQPLWWVTTDQIVQQPHKSVMSKYHEIGQNKYLNIFGCQRNDQTKIGICLDAKEFTTQISKYIRIREGPASRPHFTLL